MRPCIFKMARRRDEVSSGWMVGAIIIIIIILPYFNLFRFYAALLYISLSFWGGRRHGKDAGLWCSPGLHAWSTSMSLNLYGVIKASQSHKD